jgi:tetratricopeptide (TPR) repeat protein
VEEAIACYRQAIALDPQLAPAHTNLGNALSHQGKMEEAIASYRQAVALDPKLAMAHYNLGNALAGMGRVDEAMGCFRQAIEVDPKLALAHYNLGLALYVKGRVDEAIPCFRQAIEVDPKLAMAHHNLGIALYGKGQVDEAIACFRQAIALEPKVARAHYLLGTALYGKGQVDEAIACFRQAIALEPTHAEAHCNLGHAFMTQGRFAEGLAALKRGHELGTKQRGWPYPSATWVLQAERLGALEAQLPALLKGHLEPRDNAQRLGLVGACRIKKLYHTATRLYAAAFAEDPRLADDLNASHRCNAACSAALAATGQGEDAAKLTDKERTRLRQQALDWLRADLALGARLLADGKVDRSRVAGILKHWQQDRDLAGLRDAPALAKLPAEEQKAWTQLWADVATLVKKAEEKPN